MLIPSAVTIGLRFLSQNSKEAPRSTKWLIFTGNDFGVACGCGAVSTVADGCGWAGGGVCAGAASGAAAAGSAGVSLSRSVVCRGNRHLPSGVSFHVTFTPSTLSSFTTTSRLNSFQSWIRALTLEICRMLSPPPAPASCPVMSVTLKPVQGMKLKPAIFTGVCSALPSTRWILLA